MGHDLGMNMGEFCTFLGWVNQYNVRDDIITVIAYTYDEVERVSSRAVLNEGLLYKS
jgi:hypothetical protein